MWDLRLPLVTCRFCIKKSEKQTLVTLVFVTLELSVKRQEIENIEILKLLYNISDHLVSKLDEKQTKTF